MAFNILMYTILVSDTSKVWKKTCEFILSCLWKDNLHLEEDLNSSLHWLVHQFSVLVTLFCASNAWQEQSKPKKVFWPVTLERFQTSEGMEEESVLSIVVIVQPGPKVRITFKNSLLVMSFHQPGPTSSMLHGFQNCPSSERLKKQTLRMWGTRHI